MSEIIYPNYKNCILNTITSILKHYNVDTKHDSLNVLDEKLKNNYKNVVLIILDGMGNVILNNVSQNGFFSKNKSAVLTSVYPSTTTAALTTYYSGKPPYETGWIAWSQYFKEYGRSLDVLSHRESYFRDEIKNPKIDVYKDVINYESVFEQIEKSMPDVKAYEITPSYSDKRAKRSLRADDLKTVCENIKDLCSNDSKKFIMAYVDNPDGLLHKYGCGSEEAKNMILDAEKQIEEMCRELKDTVVIISADHGHKDIEKAYTLLDYPEIQDCLIMPPTLESRIIGFWVKDNKREEFEKLFRENFGGEFLLFSKTEFLNNNFLGFGDKHRKIDDFIGDYLALSISNSIIRLETFLVEGKRVKKSTHCGLTKDEMEVPLIII